MKRTLMLFGLSAPLLIGGWVFAGDNRPVPPAPASPPRAPTNPARPAPPAPPRVGAVGSDPWVAPGGLSINFKGLDQIKAQVTAEVARARAEIAADTSLPTDVRAAVLARMDKVTAVVERRLAKLNLGDVMNLGSQLDGLGGEIEKSMAGLEQEIKLFEKKYGRSFGKAMQASKGHFNFHFSNDDADDDDDDDDNDADDRTRAADDITRAADDISRAADDLNEAVDDIADMGINASQRTQLSALRLAEQATTKAARERLRQASAGLRAELAKPSADITLVNRFIDQISTEEGNIRKAQLKALVAAKTMLTPVQQKKVQDAAAKAKGTSK